MAVTEIMSIVNNTNYAIDLVNVENPSDNESNILSGSKGVTIWVPHAPNADEFKKHHLRLIFRLNGAIKFKWAIWQAAHGDGDHVRLSKSKSAQNWAEFEFPGNWVGGDSKAGGQRALLIYDDHVELRAAVPHVPLHPVD